VETFRTDFDGALTFTFAPRMPLRPRAAREHERRYWRASPMRDAASPLDAARGTP
jgi:hypothetical protein